MASNDLEERFEEAKQARRELEKRWMVNTAFYLGDQWLDYDPIRHSLSRPDVPSWRVLAVVNHVQPVVRTELAKLTRTRPVVGVQPTSSDPTREAQARGSEKLLRFLWDRLKTEDVLRRAMLWALVTGTGFVKVYWDPRAGEVVDDQGTCLGEVALAALSPLEVYPDPLGETMEEKQWVFHVKLRSTEWVFDNFGVQVAPTGLAGLDTVQVFPGQPKTVPRNAVLVKEYWERPSRRYPQGRMTAYTGDGTVIVEEQPLPYRDVPMPFVPITHIPVPGRFWGDSTVTQLHNPQVQYNQKKSQVAEILNLMAKPKWVVPKGTVDKPITSAPAEIIEYTVLPGSTHKPEPVAGKEVPASFYKELQQLHAEIMEISGQHEVTRAQVPSGVRSGIAISYLQEQDDTRLAPTLHALERAVERICQYELHLCRQFYLEPRLLRVLGKDSQVEVIEVSGQDIPADVDVKVQAGSALPPSRVARQQFIMQLWEQKVVQDPRVVLRLLEFGDVEGLYDDVNMDVARAGRENERLAGGQPAQVEDFDNHDVHVYEHNKYRKQQEYEDLPDEIKELFRQHVAEHQAQRMAQMGPFGGGEEWQSQNLVQGQGIVPSSGGWPPEEQGTPTPSLLG